MSDSGIWKLVPFIRPNGRSPVMDFLESLRENDADAYVAFYEFTKPLIEEHGPSIGEPHWDGLGGGLGEIRWRHDKRNYRIYCSLESARRVVMYQGLIKTWRRFRDEDRELCESRRAEFLSHEYDQEHREYLYLAQ